MLFSDVEKNKFKFLNNLSFVLNAIFEKIEDKYLTDDSKYLDFNFFVFDYNSLKKSFKYNFTYIENIISAKENILTIEQINEIQAKINHYGYTLGDFLEESHKNYISKQFFLLNVIRLTLDFFDDIKLKDSPFEIIFNNDYIDHDFNEYSKNLKFIKDSIEGPSSNSDDNLSSFHLKYNDIDSKLNDITKKYTVLENEFRIKMDNFFASKGRDFDKSVDGIILAFNKQLVEVQTPYENEIKNKISDLNDKYEESKNELLNLLGDLGSYKNILSVKTQDEISKHYFNKAKSEKITYWSATGATIFLILLSLSLVGWALYDYYTNYISISNCVGSKNINSCIADLRAVREATQSFGLIFFVMRFAFSLLLFLTVVYTSRIAIRAYNHWRHSENMHLKLASLNPFIGNLDKDKRDEIHIGLVPDYFGKDSGVIEVQKDGLKDIPTNIANVAIKALEQAGGTFGGKSNTEKNDKKPDSGTE
ncbi:hypothetical protein V7G70_17125 [Acinetobacter pittii]|uniref:hypothetical protein n=1 Tax=Acinetobacter pittii TaxID=48296 RepID=UPI002FF3A30E